MQVSEAMFKYGSERIGVKVVPVFGGQPIGRDSFKPSTVAPTWWSPRRDTLSTTSGGDRWGSTRSRP